MDKKKIMVFLVFTNLFIILCLVFLLVSHKKCSTVASMASIDAESAGSKDANSQVQSSKAQLKPEDILACFNTEKEQRRRKAIEDYSQIMRSEPPYLGDLHEVYVNAKNGQWDKAQAICDHSIQYSEDKREGLYSQAWLYAKQGRYAEAIKISKDLTANYPEFTKPYVTWGWIAVKEGRNEEAVSICQTMIKSIPGNAIGYYGLARLYSAMDKPAEAIDSYLSAIKIKPDFAEAHLFLGLAYCKQGQWADAIKPFSEAITLNHSYEQAYLFRALSYDELGLYKEASEDIEYAFSLSRLRTSTKENWSIFGIEPDYARYMSSLSEDYARLGDSHKAVLSCQDAISINPAFSEAYFNMALAYLLLGEKDKAIEQRDKLVSLKANDFVARLDELLKK